MIVARWPAWIGLGLAGAGLVGGLVMGLAMGDDDGRGGPGWGRKRKVSGEGAAPRARAYDDDSAAALARPGVEIELPRAAAGTDLTPSIKVTISADKVWLNGDEVEDDELVMQLDAAAVMDPETQVVLATGADVPYQRVFRFMDLAKRAGLKRIALSVDAP